MYPSHATPPSSKAHSCFPPLFMRMRWEWSGHVPFFILHLAFCNLQFVKDGNEVVISHSAFCILQFVNLSVSSLTSWPSYMGWVEWVTLVHQRATSATYLTCFLSIVLYICVTFSGCKISWNPWPIALPLPRGGFMALLSDWRCLRERKNEIGQCTKVGRQARVVVPRERDGLRDTRRCPQSLALPDRTSSLWESGYVPAIHPSMYVQVFVFHSSM